jgi:hypothetical protein
MAVPNTTSKPSLNNYTLPANNWLTGRVHASDGSKPFQDWGAGRTSFWCGSIVDSQLDLFYSFKNLNDSSNDDERRGRQNM